MRLVLDHIAVAGESLEAATAHVEACLGVAMQPGGQHAHFGTHNRLMGLEDGLYLEAIAVDPSAPAPGYPRWFDLDRFTGVPRIGNWICRTDDLDAAVAALPQAGVPVALSRGDVRWRMAVPNDGRLPQDNRFPALMQWQTRPTPAESLKPTGCRLTRLVIRHPEAARIEAQLAPYLRDARIVFDVGSTNIRAEFDTPSGTKVLE